MNKFKIPIIGMHCKSCEMLIEDGLKEAGFKKCEVSHKHSCATVFYDNKKPDMEKIENVVRSAGYAIGNNEKGELFSKDMNDYKDLFIAFIIVAVGYFILKTTGLISINLGGATDPSNLSVVFLVGLTAGISTCMALVGGLVLSMSAKHAEKHPEATALEKFRPHLFFNLGRVIGFGVLGGILGLVGTAFEISSTVNGILIILVGIVMFILGLQIIDIFPWLKNFSITLPKGVAEMFGFKSNEKEYSHKKAVILGMLTFFLPCGFTQSMQIFALSSGSFVGGALIMSLFALGTAPGLLSIGGLTSFVKGIFAKRFFKFAGIVVIFLSIFNISNGIGLTGYEIDWSSSNVETRQGASGQPQEVQDPNVKMVNGIQVVSMEENGDGYSPNKFTIKKGVPVKWVIDAKEPYSCATALVIPKLDTRKFLKAGENIIEFTPSETGKLAFSCSMGMYTGAFNVIE